MTEENKKRSKLTISKLGKSALKAGAAATDDNHGQVTSHNYQDCAGKLDTFYNDTGVNEQKTMGRK